MHTWLVQFVSLDLSTYRGCRAEPCGGEVGRSLHPLPIPRTPPKANIHAYIPSTRLSELAENPSKLLKG